MHPVQTMSNGAMGNGVMDPSGTINPAALDSAGMLAFSYSERASPLCLSSNNKHSPEGTLVPASCYIRRSFP